MSVAISLLQPDGRYIYEYYDIIKRTDYKSWEAMDKDK